MKVFEIDLDESVRTALIEHAVRDYPAEACGLVFGPSGPSPQGLEVVPMKNEQDRYHQLDPERFPRTARDAFRINELQRARALEAGESKGHVERILYHSHCDAGAYFSPEDRAMIVHDGVDLMPGVIHVVVSVRNGAPFDMAAYRYDEKTDGFDEVRIGVRTGPSAQEGLPDLELRAMEGREAARPIRPVGGVLALRRVAHSEEAHLLSLAGARSLTVGARIAQTLSDFERGLYSPLTGFLRDADIRSVQSKGRLQGGAQWRAPVFLELESAQGFHSGDVVALQTAEGAPLGVLAIAEDEAGTGGKRRLAGPVYLFARSTQDAAQSRAALLRVRAQQVLAVPAKYRARAERADLDRFDALIMGGDPLPKKVFGQTQIPLLSSPKDPWLAAAMAQNQGATHIWMEDSAAAATVESTLQIRAFRQAEPNTVH